MIPRKKRAQLWVHEDFKTLLKHKAIDEKVPVTDLTSYITDIEIDPMKKEKKR